MILKLMLFRPSGRGTGSRRKGSSFTAPFHLRPPEPIESLDQWEALERQYWERYAKVITETGWEPPEKARELVASRMEMFQKQAILTDQRWRRARGL